MLQFLLRRLFFTTFLLTGVVMITFALARLIPGDPARLIAGARANAEAVQNVRDSLGLDLPVWQQFERYVTHILQGDFGTSVVTRRPILDDMTVFLPATLELVIYAAVLSVLLGVAAGTLAAVRASRRADFAVRGGAVLGLSVPDFWIALVAQLIFFASLGWLPFGGRLPTGAAPPEAFTGLYSVDSLLAGNLELFGTVATHLLMPVVVLSIPSAAIITRVVRTTMLDVLNEDFIRMAWAKGLRPHAVYLRHALRNALLPVITVFGLNLGVLMSGAVFIELIFDWPGLGRYTADSIASSDYNAIMAITLVVSVAYTVINMLVDLSYAVFDPRVRLS